MTNQDYQKRLEANKDLHELISSKNTNILVQYPEIPKEDQGFIDWLSPQYLEVFTHIVNEYYGTKNESRIVKLLNSPLYCNDKTKEEIIDFIAPFIQKKIDQSKKISAELKGKIEDFVPIANAGGLNVLDPFNIAIFQKIDHPKISRLKAEAVDLSIDICNKLKKRSTKDLAYKFFEQLLQQLGKLNLDGEQKINYEGLVKKGSRKAVGAKVGGVLVVLLIIIKLLSKILD